MLSSRVYPPFLIFQIPPTFKKYYEIRDIIFPGYDFHISRFTRIAQGMVVGYHIIYGFCRLYRVWILLISKSSLILVFRGGVPRLRFLRLPRPCMCLDRWHVDTNALWDAL